MGLAFLYIIMYLIFMITILFTRKRKIENEERKCYGDSSESLFLVIIGAGILAYASNDSDFTRIMIGILIASFTIIYIIYWISILIIETKRG